VSAFAAAVVRDTVAGYGYRVDAGDKPALALSAAFTRETFDKSGEYLVFKGTARARLASMKGDGVLYEKTFSAKGRRGLGEAAAARNLAEELSSQLTKWLGETLEPRVFFAKHPDLAE
jgi:hypothetical protein